MKFLIYRISGWSVPGLPKNPGKCWARLIIDDSIKDNELLNKNDNKLTPIVPWEGGFLDAIILSPRSLQKYENIISFNTYLNSDTAQRIVELCDKEEK